MKIAKQQTNDTEGPIKSPYSNGQPKVEPVFLAFEYDGMTWKC